MMDSDLPPGSCNSTGHLSTIGYHTVPGRMHHSASTPAGVDGAGGARTPPATPKKGGKMLAVRILMLNDSVSMFQVQSKALGRVLFDQVCRQLHLLEADYFGLEYQDANGTKFWLDVEKAMCRQVGLSMLEPTLRFCVKFYTPDPARLEEEFTRYLFCLQIKRDLAQGCIQCNENTAALMASYIVQAECGDFVPEDYPDHTYLSGYKFFPGQDSESERRIMENHKKHVGQSPAEADLNLLETARRCELYGMKMHPAKDHENVPLNLAVAHMGIVVFQNFTKINTFSWAKIRKISFKRKKFLIKLHPEGYGYYRDVVEFFFEGRNECKNFWKKCVENHGFFRCTAVQRIPRHKARVMSRGSSFRYSGKTQKQIVEFVRENYVKRQTFQRSGSFRASRSLRSSRVNMNAPPMNASISAHPLLPLPPGSDAISLEWDKQPHYLEASLMMKGYTEEAAREAASAMRSGARRSSEGARHLLAPTACAAMRDKAAPELVTQVEVNHHPTEESPLPHRTMIPSASPESIWSRMSSRVAPATTIEFDHSQQHHAPEYTLPDLTPCSLTEDETVSSASLLISPQGAAKSTGPLSASTPLPAAGRINGDGAKEKVATSYNGLDRLDNRHTDPNENYENGGLRANENAVNVVNVSESTNSIDVLSGGESDAGDTLSRSRHNNNSITSCVRDSISERCKRRGLGTQLCYLLARELLMTERTYKRDLELVTVAWSSRVSALASSDTLSDSEDTIQALGRPCLALEPLALAQGAFLARLEKCLYASTPSEMARGNTKTTSREDNEEPDFKRIPELFHDYLSKTYDEYMSYCCRAGVLVARVESTRRGGARDADAACSAFDASSPLPIACLLLRPLHRLLYYASIANELWASCGGGSARAANELGSHLAQAASEQLRHAENHAALCQLQRDIAGYEKLLVADREFLRLGCLYKHSSKGLQQRMLFLFSDVMVLAWKAGGGGGSGSSGGGGSASRFRAHAVLPLHMLRLQTCDLPHTFTISDEESTLMLSASNEHEFAAWCADLERAIAHAQKEHAADVDTELTPYDQHEDTTSGCSDSGSGGWCAGGGLAHVCWHRATSLSRDHMHLAMQTQLSGYLLRKFKNSHGWQKLWVVFAVFSLYFYKSWQDEKPLASLPLLGYSVGPPAETDGIHKDFVFKLQFKNHIYFFRADSHYTYDRWTDTLQTTMRRLEK